jgi:hypothetical protein
VVSAVSGGLCVTGWPCVDAWLVSTASNLVARSLCT